MALRASCALALIAGGSAQPKLDCTQIVTDGYSTVLARSVNPTTELSDNVTACKTKKSWPMTPGQPWSELLAGQTWSAAGMVYQMRNSKEYAAKPSNDPFKEKGGCQFCECLYIINWISTTLHTESLTANAHRLGQNTIRVLQCRDTSTR